MKVFLLNLFDIARNLADLVDIDLVAVLASPAVFVAVDLLDLGLIAERLALLSLGAVLAVLLVLTAEEVGARLKVLYKNIDNIIL